MLDFTHRNLLYSLIATMTAVIKGKIVKRKIQTVEFGAENIDNTAPVNKILEDLEHSNSQAFAFYSQTVRQRRTTKEQHYSFHHAVTGHPLKAFSDDWDGDLVSGYFEAFPYKSLMPKMLTKMENLDKSDPVIEHMRLKSNWYSKSRKLRSAAAIGNMMQKYESLNDEVLHCPKHFVDMAAHLDSDPDPYFDSPYNWYYAGSGNLQIICVDWVDYLLHSEFSTVYITQFEKIYLSVNLEHAASFDCGEGINILETICSSQNIIALRTQKRIHILRIVLTESNLDIENVKVLECELPFTSISFDDHHKNILYVTTLENKLTIVNLDRLTGRSVDLKSKIDSPTDNWGTVIGSERAYYTHVAKKTITIYDKRTNNPIHIWNNVRDITDDVGCNDITVAKQTEGSSYLYFGTDHHLFLTDLRNCKKSKLKAVMRWTHGMQCVPTYMSICNFEFNKEIICLSSQWCEDTCVIPNYADKWKRADTNGVTIPYRPPSVFNTVNEARQRLLCLDLYNTIDTRLCTAITGNMIIEQDENYVILMQNSLGDISSHILYPEHLESFIEDNSVEQINEWSKYYKQKRKDFEVSSIVDFTKIWKMLRKVPDSHKIGEGKLMTQEKSKFNEEEIFEAFKNEELDSGLLDVWMQDQNETTEASSFALNLHYSDGE